MIYLSVCSGIEAATVAWKPLGWKPLAFAEIDRFACALLEHHYPGVPNWGDLTKFKDWPDADVDVLVGGTPCQSFSVAGLRAGMDDERGQLAFAFAGVAARYRPRWIVWENVPGVLSSNEGRDFAGFVSGLVELGYGCAWRVLDAQYFHLAQRRARVFVVGHLGDWARAAAVLLERASLRGDPAPSRAPRQDLAAGTLRRSQGGSDVDHARTSHLIAGTLDAAMGRSRGAGTSPGGLVAGRRREDDVNLVAFGGNNTSGAIEMATAVRAKGGTGHGDFESETFIVPFDTTQITHPANRSNPKSGDPCHPLTGSGHAPAGAFNVLPGVRRLTPRECERLQGFDDNYTLIRADGADGPRYRALGNSMAVPVMRWIGRRIAAVEAVR